MVGDRKQVFFVMDLFDTDFFTVIEKDNVGGQFALKALLSTAYALDSLHRAGIIYCDLKPENILVNETTGQAAFSDFDRSFTRI